MGEKPMGTPVDEEEPDSPAATINTTRSNIKTQGVAGSAQPGGSAGVTGDPIPGIDTK